MDPVTTMLITSGVMAGLGYLQGERQRKAQEAYNKAQAEITRYSPWTGMRGQITPVTASGFDGAMQGALSGAMFGQNLAKIGGGTTPDIDKMTTTQVAKYNTPLFESDQFDKMIGYKKDASNSVWSRVPSMYSGNRMMG